MTEDTNNFPCLTDDTWESPSIFLESPQRLNTDLIWWSKRPNHWITAYDKFRENLRTNIHLFSYIH